MELRLFIVACIMYAFTLTTRYFKKKKEKKFFNSFAWWHSLFLFLILSCAVYVALFVMGGGTGEPMSMSKLTIGLVGALLCAIYGYFKSKKTNEKEKNTILKADLEWSNTVYFAGFVASFVMFFFIQAFQIPSESMYNTLIKKDHLFVNKAAYGFRIPFTNIRFGEFNKIKQGDIIVFQFPAKDRKQQNCGGSQYGKDFVKRVIAMPGDTVQIIDGRPWVNGQKLPQQDYELYDDVERVSYQEEEDLALYQQLWEEHQLDQYLGIYLRDSLGPVKVPEGHYFAMGDNRDNSCDSRFWGPVPRENIKGKAWFIHWPLNRIRMIK